MIKTEITPQLQKDEIYRHVDYLIDPDAADHLESLHDLYDGYMKSMIHESADIQPDVEKVEFVSYTYGWLRDLLKAIVKAEREYREEKVKFETLNNQ